MPRKAKQTIDIKIAKPTRKVRRVHAPKNVVGGGGDYKSFIKKGWDFAKNIIPKGSSAMAGKLMAGPAGGIIGDLISKVSGIGDYSHNANKIQHNALFKGGDSTALQIPQFSPGKHGVQVAHREYIGDIVCGTGTPSAFTISNFEINPGLASTFPWLSQIAQNFETYRFHGLIFECKALVTDNNATFGSLGSLIQCAAYNSANPNFINKFQMENYEGSVSSKPSQSQLFGIECDPRDIPENHLFVRSNAIPSGQDEKTYDLANYQVATVGQPVASQTVCELWVSYILDLMQPKLYAGQLGYGVNYAHYSATGTTTQISTSAYFGTNAVANSNSNLVLTLASAAGTITFPANIVTGAYILILHYTTSSNAEQGPTVGFTTNCTALALYAANTIAQSHELDGAAQVSCTTTAFFTVTGSAPVLTVSGGTLTANVTNMDLIISQIPVNAN